ncbi:hypothetical protein DAI22_06g149100 [Oryza sativa Japonica Group]|nr:hypothetical protein DAI22_06g149100 [Oryza sativa Japonica Group]
MAITAFGGQSISSRLIYRRDKTTIDLRRQFGWRCLPPSSSTGPSSASHAAADSSAPLGRSFRLAATARACPTACEAGPSLELASAVR